ncbi:hypothetical protein RQN30_08415 [Arcanobacterium hippocoleae]
MPTLRLALEATSKKRGSFGEIKTFPEILESITRDSNMLARWKIYAQEYTYVNNISLAETCLTALTIMEKIVNEI